VLRELTKKYVQAFNSRNIEKVAELLIEDFSLEDPVVKRIEGKSKVLEAIKGIFNSCQELSFKAKNIYQDNNTTIIEFVLILDSTVLSGIDIIEWEGEKMKELRAYLDIPCDEK